MRLMYISSKKHGNFEEKKNDLLDSTEKKSIVSEFKTDVIDQIKNVTQEKKVKPESQTDIKAKNFFFIDSFEKLLEICNQNKEIKLKYELEKNVNLVRFEKNRIEISFNDNLEKNFVKDLSLKLFEWTGERWIITLSKVKGEISVKEKKQNKKNEMIKKAKNSKLFKKIIEKFPDANLVEVISKKEKNDWF